MDLAPRLAIGSWPTPVQRLDRVSEELGVEVWVKLEESCGAWGGNKVRKLEYILGRARSDGVVRLVGYGAGTSNWASALAFHGAEQGVDVDLVLFTNEVPPELVRLYRSLGTRYRHVPQPLVPIALGRALVRSDRSRTRLLPPGGTGRDGNLGAAHIGEEIARAIEDNTLPHPAKVFVAVGTGGTAAGIAVGAERGGRALDVVCVRVAPRPFGTLRVVTRAARSLGASVGSHLAGDDRFFAPGYACPNPESLAAAELARLDGLELDGTYAAKAFASLIAHARAGVAGPLLFVHTSPGPLPQTC